MIDAVAEDRRIENHRSTLAETVEVQIERRGRDCERCSFCEFDDTRKLPATERLAQQTFLTAKERKAVSAIHRKSMRRMEA